jgi:hypothetical protein
MNNSIRILEFRRQNLFDTRDACEADIIVCETNIEQVKNKHDPNK